MAQLPDEDKLRAKVQQILDEQINPAIASHGGTISLIDVQENRLFIKMGGGCQGCASANVTLREGVERAIREQVPEVGEILDVSDHAAGTNPYYARH
jgi:Fe/S biogenesis protein NfuA